MMNFLKRLFTLSCLSIFCSSQACDICGNYMGITPYDNKSSISFLHRYRIYNGYRDYQQQSRFFPTSAYKIAHGDLPRDTTIPRYYSSKDFESYKIFELRFKYFVMKRLEVNVFLPVLDNKAKANTVYIHHTGFGDISFNSAFHVITPKADKKIRQKLLIGLGVKLATGNFYAHDQQSNRLPFEMQPGTGSVDGFGYFNYMLMMSHWGTNINVNYKANGKNIYNEHMANSHNDFITVFYKLQYKSVIFYPSVQANYEYTKGLYIKKELQKNTDVNALLLGPGLDLYYKSFSINLSWQFTTFERISTGNLKGAGRINLGLNYSFNKKAKS